MAFERAKAEVSGGTGGNGERDGAACGESVSLFCKNILGVQNAKDCRS